MRPITGRYALDGPPPAGVSVQASRCECTTSTSTEWPPGGYFSGVEDLEGGAWLRPGTYRLRAYGPIGSSLDYELIAPCDYHAQNCGPGQQCFLGGVCLEEVPDPAPSKADRWHLQAVKRSGEVGEDGFEAIDAQNALCVAVDVRGSCRL